MEKPTRNTHSSLYSSLVQYEETKVLLIRPWGLYSQHFIFFITYEQAQKVRVFVLGKPFQLNVMQHSSLSDQFTSYEENEFL
jgi:hypothetical protein